MKANLIILLLFCLVQSACAHRLRVGVSEAQKAYTRFGVGLPPDSWQQKSFKNADLYFEHRNSSAMIYISAHCEKISDSPLEALNAQILIGLREIQIIKEERIMLAGREALVTELSAKIDGVPRFLKMIVLRKNRCVYDAVFNSSQEQSGLVKDFDQMIEGFWAEAEL